MSISPLSGSFTIVDAESKSQESRVKGQESRVKGQSQRSKSMVNGRISAPIGDETIITVGGAVAEPSESTAVLVVSPLSGLNAEGYIGNSVGFTHGYYRFAPDRGLGATALFPPASAFLDRATRMKRGNSFRSSDRRECVKEFSASARHGASERKDVPAVLLFRFLPEQKMKNITVFLSCYTEMY